MNSSRYFKETQAFASYEGAGTKSLVAKTYVTIALGGEFGEFLNKLKKLLRNDGSVSSETLLSEMGDVFWYLSQMRVEYGVRTAANYGNTLFEFHGYENPHLMREVQKFISEYSKVLKILNSANQADQLEHTVSIENNWKNLFKCAASICNYLGESYEVVMQKNIDKLKDRASRGVLYGSGDDR